MQTVYRLKWTNPKTGATGFLPDAYDTEHEARQWAREWTQTMRNLDPERQSEIIVRVHYTSSSPRLEQAGVR